MKFSTTAIVIVSGFGPAMGLSSYLNQMSGGGAAKPSSYGPNRGKPQAPPGGTGIGGFSPTTPPSSNGYEAPPDHNGHPAPASSDYLSQVNNGQQQVSGGYLSQVNNGHQQATGPKTSYAPTKSTYKYGGSGIGGYLDQFAGPPAAPEQSMVDASAPPAPTSSNYLSQVGSGPQMHASPGPKTSYAPTKSTYKYGGSGIGGYLDQFAGPPDAVPEDSMVGNAQSASAADMAPTSSGYFSQMGGGSAATSNAPKTSYAPTKSNFKSGGSGIGGYLDSFAGPPAAPEQSMVDETAPPAPTSSNYLSKMGSGTPTGTSTGPKTSYAPTKSTYKYGGSGIGGYLDQFGGPPVADPEDSMVANHDENAPPSASDYLSSVGGGASAMKPSTYGPKANWKNSNSNGGTGMGGYSPSANAPPSFNGYQEPSAPAANAAPSSSDYLSQMGGGGGAMKKSGYGPKKNW